MKMRGAYFYMFKTDHEMMRRSHQTDMKSILAVGKDDHPQSDLLTLLALTYFVGHSSSKNSETFDICNTQIWVGLKCLDVGVTKPSLFLWWEWNKAAVRDALNAEDFEFFVASLALNIRKKFSKHEIIKAMRMTLPTRCEDRRSAMMLIQIVTETYERGDS